MSQQQPRQHGDGGGDDVGNHVGGGVRCLSQNVCLLPPGITSRPRQSNHKDARAQWLQAYVLPAFDVICWQELFDAPWCRVWSQRVPRLLAAAADLGFSVTTMFTAPWFEAHDTSLAAAAERPGASWWRTCWYGTARYLWSACAALLPRRHYDGSGSGSGSGSALLTSPWYDARHARDLGWTCIDAGLVTLSRRPVLDSAFCPFPAPRDGWSTEAVATKGVLYTLLDRGPAAGGLVHLFNTHLHSDQRTWTCIDGVGREDRHRQLQVLRSFLVAKTSARPDLPVYVCGDLNIDPVCAADEYRAARHGLQATDCLQAAGFHPGATVTLGLGTGEQTITCADDQQRPSWIDHLWQIEGDRRPEPRPAQDLRLYTGRRTARGHDYVTPSTSTSTASGGDAEARMSWTHISDHRGIAWSW